jgi:hypothetical protein
VTTVDASPSRERLGRVVELLRGVEDPHVRWTAHRTGRPVRNRRHAPLRAIEPRWSSSGETDAGSA